MLCMFYINSRWCRPLAMSLASALAADDRPALATDGLFNFRDPIPFAASPIASPLAPSKSLKQEAEARIAVPRMRANVPRVGPLVAL